MKSGVSLCILAASLAGASAASAGWFSGNDHYLGRRHDAHFNNRFLQRPCPPYHGWNRPLYGWSSNYRPYYFTPQSYANTPWNYGPGYQATVYQTAAPTPGLNAFGVPTQSTTTEPKPTVVPQAPVIPPSSATPTPAVPTPAPPPAMIPAIPTPSP